MRTFRLFGVVLVLSLLLAGCGTQSGDTPQAAQTGATQGGGSESRGGNLVVGVDADGYTLEGPRITVGMYPHHAQIYEQLTQLTPDYQLEPMLATDWEFVEPRTWRFNLREGVTFHDGQPFNAEAVKAGLFDRYAAMDGGGPIQVQEDSVKVVDEYTIEFTPPVQLPIPAMIAHPNYGIAATGSNLATEPVGTGPFKFVEYVTQDRLVVERNDDYWGDLAHLDRLTIRFFPDPDARRLALVAGEVDAAFEIARSAVQPLKDRGFVIATSPVGSYQALYVNATGQPPFDTLSNRDVRRAVSHAINREALVENVYEGLATTDQTWVPPSVLGEHAESLNGLDYDPEQARSLLEGAGYALDGEGFYAKNGQRLTLTLVSGFPTATANRPAPTFVQGQLRELGIEVEIVEVPDSPSFGARVEAGEGDLFMETGNQNDGNPAFLPLFIYTGPGGYAGRALAEPANQKWSDAMATAMASSSIDEMRGHVAEALKVIVDEEATMIPVAGIFRIYGLSDAVSGFDPHPSFSHQKWHTVRLEE